MIANILLEIKAVKLSPENPFTWTSGIKSPIYCDNRQIISYPKHRSVIIEQFCKRIRTLKNVDCIAGTATAGIPWAAWIAHELELPMIYIRSSNKSHGLGNAIEGAYKKGQRAVLIEDLISTGKSSIEACLKLQGASIEVLEVQSIFNYGISVKKFLDNNIKFHSLESLDTLLTTALDINLLDQHQVETIMKWKEDLKVH
ncbi:MAG: orotate phosphoribosyltransferase [Bacteriovoracaceae bacterium]|nr:orotate phosphoribosyltransferase [Bacteriovoracaceae bacterium]